MTAGRPKKDWSGWKCKRCGTDKKGGYREYCHSCYQTTLHKMKYETDPIFREKTKARIRKTSLAYFHKRNKADPTWNARKQKKFRDANPDSFNLCMCRCYLRKLSPEVRAKLWAEMEKEKV